MPLINPLQSTGKDDGDAAREQMSVSRNRAERSASPPPCAVKTVSFGIAFATLTVAIQWGIYLLLSPYSDDCRYPLGGLAGWSTHFVFGSLAAVPFCVKPSRWIVAPIGAAAFGVLFSLFAIAGYHYHAVFNRLPGLEALDYLLHPGALRASINAHAPAPLVLLEALVAPLGALFLAPRIGTLLRKVSTRYAVAPLVILLTAGWTTTPLLTGQGLFGALHPLLYLFAARQPDSEPTIQVQENTPAKYLRLINTQLGFEDRPTPDKGYPYCGESRPAPTPPERRSIFLIILEGISNRELTASHRGLPLMPKLNRRARRGLSFSQFKAVGDHSSQALFSLLAGVPPETHRRVISHSRLVSFTGFPRQFEKAGFETAYFHGSDLSFEQQRRLLRKAGYVHIVEPSSEILKDQAAWGLSDGAMFEKLRHWAEAQREEKPDTPLLATLFTLSTHDPYVLPDEHLRIFSGDDGYTRFAESVRYLDDVLDEFIEWFIENEKPEGSILAVVADHAPRIKRPNDPADTSTGEFEYRFGVPLLLFGNAVDALTDKSEISARPGSHTDLAKTLCALAGAVPPACSTGTDLLAPDFPENRRVISIAGDRLSYLFIHAPPYRWTANLDTHTLQVFDTVADPLFRQNLSDSQTEEIPNAVNLIDAYMTLGAYLNLKDRFAPPISPSVRPLPAAAHSPLRIVSHRGATRGPNIGPRENTLAAFDTAISAGFEWIELDVQLTADHIPVVHHDDVLAGATGGEPVSSLSLEALRQKARYPVSTLREVLTRYDGRVHFLVELKKQPTWFLSMKLTHEAIALFAEVKQSEIMVDSFSAAVAGAAAEFSQAEVGWDTPQKPFSADWLTFASDQHMEWLFLRSDLADESTIEKLHDQGLKAMLYTVNDPAELSRFTREFPDGIITDRADLLSALEKKKEGERGR